MLPEDTEETKPEDNQDITTLETLADELRARFPDRQETLPDNSDLVINLVEPGRWVYYFADTSRRKVFWVDKVKVEDLVVDSHRYVQSGGHLGRHSFLYFLMNRPLN